MEIKPKKTNTGTEVRETYEPLHVLFVEAKTRCSKILEKTEEFDGGDFKIVCNKNQSESLAALKMFLERMQKTFEGMEISLTDLKMAILMENKEDEKRALEKFEGHVDYLVEPSSKRRGSLKLTRFSNASDKSFAEPAIKLKEFVCKFEEELKAEGCPDARKEKKGCDSKVSFPVKPKCLVKVFERMKKGGFSFSKDSKYENLRFKSVFIEAATCSLLSVPIHYIIPSMIEEIERTVDLFDGEVKEKEQSMNSLVFKKMMLYLSSYRSYKWKNEKTKKLTKSIFGAESDATNCVRPSAIQIGTLEMALLTVEYGLSPSTSEDRYFSILNARRLEDLGDENSEEGKKIQNFDNGSGTIEGEESCHVDCFFAEIIIRTNEFDFGNFFEQMGSCFDCFGSLGRPDDFEEITTKEKSETLSDETLGTK